MAALGGGQGAVVMTGMVTRGVEAPRGQAHRVGRGRNVGGGNRCGLVHQVAVLDTTHVLNQRDVDYSTELRAGEHHHRRDAEALSRGRAAPAHGSSCTRALVCVSIALVE